MLLHKILHTNSQSKTEKIYSRVLLSRILFKLLGIFLANFCHLIEYQYFSKKVNVL